MAAGTRGRHRHSCRFVGVGAMRDNDDPMSMPTWWNQRRFGIFVHSNLATVPAWSPIGEYSDWYRSHLGEDVADVWLHPKPMVEVLAHHRDRWGHIERFDDFLPLLTYDRFDAEEHNAIPKLGGGHLGIQRNARGVSHDGAGDEAGEEAVLNENSDTA